VGEMGECYFLVQCTSLASLSQTNGRYTVVVGVVLMSYTTVGYWQ